MNDRSQKREAQATSPLRSGKSQHRPIPNSNASPAAADTHSPSRLTCDSHTNGIVTAKRRTGMADFKGLP